MKKFFAVLLAVALVATLAACGNNNNGGSVVIEKGDPLGKYEELVTITRGAAIDPNMKYPAGQSISDNYYTQALKEKYNIEVKNAWEATDYVAKVNASIASGDIPDYLTNLTYTQYKAAKKAGLVADLMPYWNAYASDRSKDVYASNKALFDSLVVEDGKMYAIPSSQPEGDFLSVMWIRQDWLDKLGLKAPQTIADLETVAKAFRDKDPDGDGKADTVGIIGPGKGNKIYNTAYSHNNFLHLDQIFAAYKSYPGIWQKDADGNVVWGSTTAETKEALTKLQQMYKDGLFDKALFTNEAQKQVAGNQGGILFGTWWYPFVDLAPSVKADPKADWQPYTFNNADGKYIAKAGNAAQSFTIVSNKAKNPEAVIKMLNIFKNGLDQLITSEQKAEFGGDGAYPAYMTFSNAKSLGLGVQEAQKFWAGEVTADQAKENLSQYDAYVYEAFQKITAAKQAPFDKWNISTWKFNDIATDYAFPWSFGVGLQPYINDASWDWITSLSFEKTKTYESKGANLETLEYTTFSEIITGKKEVSEFDAFVTKWKAEGGDEITKEIAEGLE